MMIGTGNMEIDVLIDEEFEGCPETGWLQSVAEQILVAHNVGTNVEMGLVIASENRVQRLNQCYLGKDRPTDVLAFSASEETEADFPPFVQPPNGVLHLGEVIISYPQAVNQSREQKHSIKKELTILIIHGMLHLLGYKHDEPKQERQMKAKETEIMSRLEKELS